MQEALLAAGLPEKQEGSGSCLWIGDLSAWMDENWLKRIFAPTQALISCKVIRHKTTQMSRGYGFLLFNSHDAASQVLTQLNGKLIPGTDQTFRLNWAANGRQGNAGPTDFSLFVGDLAEEVTDYMLQEAFRRVYPSVRSAKVMRAPLSGRSRNFGFCRFSNEQERDRALVEMNGHEISGRPVRVSLATAKKTQTGLPALGPPPTDDPGNTTLFVGGLSEQVTEEELQNTFSLFGALLSVKCLPSRGCAFVQFSNAAAAKAAMTMLQEQVLAGSPMRISWGRHSLPLRSSPQLQHISPTSSYSYPGSVVPGSAYGGGYAGPAGLPSISDLASSFQQQASLGLYSAQAAAAAMGQPRLPPLGQPLSALGRAGRGLAPLSEGQPERHYLPGYPSHPGGALPPPFP